jgi:O-Antigen ligase
VALLLPGLLILAAALVLTLFDGGYPETVWYPVALFVLALVVLVLVVAPPPGAAGARGFAAGFALLGLFTLWSYASMLWADAPSDAWTAANRTLLYLLAFGLVAMRPWTAAAATWAVALVGSGVAAIAIGTLVATAAADDPSTLFVGHRLAEPLSYPNATANLWLVGLFPLLHLAVAREVPWPLRGPALGAAALLLEVALLSQSRGALLAFIVTAAVFVVLHPRHWAALLALAAPLAAVALGWDTLTDVRRADTSAELVAALGDARGWIALSCGILAAIGSAAALGDVAVRRRLGASVRRTRGAARAFYAVAAAALVAGVVVVASSSGWLDDRWRDFKSGDYAAVEGGDDRFGALGSGRYDFYRVSLNEWRDHPFAGVGAENFQVPYLQQRRTLEAPRYAHSLAFSVLSTLGLVGTILLAGFLVAVGAAFAVVRLRGSPAARGVAVGALGGGLAWLSHAMVDWLWEFPALALLGLGLFAVAARTSDDDVGGPARRAWPFRTVAARAVLGVLLVGAAVSLALPGAAARFEGAGFDAQSTDPDAAFERLSRAADLDPLDADALVGRAVLLRRGDRPNDARADLREAIEREPKNWFAHFELALLEAEQRHWGSAERSVATAGELNPGQRLIGDVRKRIAARRTVDAGAVERALGGQLSARLQPFDAD